MLFIKRFSHYIELDLFRFLVLIENRPPPAFCFAINCSVDNVSGDGIATQFFPLHTHIPGEMSGQRLFYR